MNLNNKSSVEALRHQLESAGVDTENWGQNKSKSIEDLKKEIENGETELILSQNGEILRKTRVARVNIFFQNDEGETLKLIEERRLYANGREKFRDKSHSISKKIKNNQTPENAIKKAIIKKLGISDEIKIEETDTVEDTNMSPSYPSLRSVYVFHNFKSYLSKEQFNSEGYIGKQSDKVTYYVWKNA